MSVFVIAARSMNGGLRPCAVLLGFAALVQSLILDCRQAVGQEAETNAVLKPRQVKHLLNVSVAAAPGYVHSKDSKATLSVVIRISDHALDSHFYGGVIATFSDVSLTDSAPEKRVWEDRTCHQYRGVPKVAVVGVDGSLTDAGKTILISARPRHIGKRVPADEVSAGVPLPGGVDESGPFRLIRSETKQTRIALTLRLYSLGCRGGP